jgi:uncharacterized protein (DUF2267 family)
MNARQLVRGAGAAAEAIGKRLRDARETPAGRAVRDAGARVGRTVRYVRSAAPGVVYRFRSRQPDPNVSDDIVTQRVRSALGSLTRRLDVPRVHVLVEDHVAILHGDVATESDARAVEAAAMRVSGVVGVESHLHVGLERGDTRPSQGATTRASDALVALLDAAGIAGAHDARAAVHAVLCGFAERIPADARDHLLTHLPADVRQLAGPPRRMGQQARRVKTVQELVADVVARGGIEPSRAESITFAVLGKLRELVPEERRDIAAVLPGELREMWEHAPSY